MRDRNDSDRGPAFLCWRREKINGLRVVRRRGLSSEETDKSRDERYHLHFQTVTRRSLAGVSSRLHAGHGPGGRRAALSTLSLSESRSCVSRRGGGAVVSSFPVSAPVRRGAVYPPGLRVDQDKCPSSRNLSSSPSESAGTFAE